MTKNELINKIFDIYRKVESALRTIKMLEDEIKDIKRVLEYIPDEAADITDDKEDE